MPKVAVSSVRLYYKEQRRGTPIMFIPGLIGLGAQDVAGLLGGLAIPRAHIVGASTGGAIANMLGLDHAQRVLSLTLVSTWARLDPYFGRLQEMRKEVLLGLGVPACIRLMSLWTAGPTQFRDTLDRLDTYEAEQVRQAAPVEVMAARIDATLKHDRFTDLLRIATPTMVVVADDDTLVPPHLGEQIAAAIPGARLARMKEGGHNCYRKDPTTYNRLLINFLGALFPERT